LTYQHAAANLYLAAHDDRPWRPETAWSLSPLEADGRSPAAGQRLCVIGEARMIAILNLLPVMMDDPTSSESVTAAAEPLTIVATCILIVQFAAYGYLLNLVRQKRREFSRETGFVTNDSGDAQTVAPSPKHVSRTQGEERAAGGTERQTAGSARTAEQTNYDFFVDGQGVGQRSFLMSVAFLLPLGVSVVSVLSNTFTGHSESDSSPRGMYPSAMWGIGVASFVLMITLELSYLYDIYQQGEGKMAKWLPPLLMTLVFDFLSYLAFVLVLGDPMKTRALQVPWMPLLIGLVGLIAFFASFECLYSIRTARRYLDTKR
jgi:hypothetical protein